MKLLRSNLSKLLSAIFILITGAGIGWLIGLSVSPVVSIVITSVTGSAAAIIAAMSGLEKKTTDADQSQKNENPQTQWAVNPLPLAVLVVGLIGGSIVGIYARNNDLLGPDISIHIRKWSEAGISKEEIGRRLFDRQFPVTGSNSNVTPPPGTSVLFTVSVEQCAALDKAIARSKLDDPAALVNALRRIEQLKSLPDIVSDPELLETIVEEVLCP